MIAREKEKGSSFDRAYKMIIWPKKAQTWNMAIKDPTDSKQDKSQTVTLTFKTHCWDYDGCFQKQTFLKTVTHVAPPGETVPIKDLEIFPLQYAEEGTRASLIARGKKFWDYRHRKYVSYDGWDVSREENCVSFCAIKSYSALLMDLF